MAVDISGPFIKKAKANLILEINYTSIKKESYNCKNRYCFSRCYLQGKEHEIHIVLYNANSSLFFSKSFKVLRKLS